MPYFRHDCMNPKCCRYVGSTEREANDRFDVYTYRGVGGQTHLILRYGDEGAAYSAMPLWHYKEWAERDDKRAQTAVRLYRAYMGDECAPE